MSDDIERDIEKVFAQRQAIYTATGILMQTNQLTATEAAWRLRHMTKAFHISTFEIASVIIETQT